MVASQGPVTQPGQKSRRRGNMSCSSCWDPVHPWGACPCAGAHPPGMLTLVAYPCHITWNLIFGHSRMQGSLKGSAPSKMHALVVCVFTLVFTTPEQPGLLECVVSRSSLKVCCLSINKVGVSVSSAVYKLDVSLQFLVPCLYAPVKGIG